MTHATHLTDAERTAVALTSPNGLEVRADVVRTGTGPRVVFLHGLVGLNEHWEEVVARIRDKAECITLELPLLELRGDDCSLWSVVEMTQQFLDRHVDGPSVLVGNSFGGHVALRIAHRRPDLVRALVLAGSSGLIERTMVRGAPVRPSKEWLEEKIGELFYDKSVMNPGDVERAYKLLNERGGARAMVKLSKTARRDNMTDDLADIACPTLLIWGKQDVVTPPSAGQGFTELMPDARIVWLENCGHAPMLESPIPFAEAMRSFLDELETRER
ncbi:MAG: alpha/beta hydrolase [Planctomycetota bacterium]|nr:MAG: alpha/beta hydrolase [Planctomycetota bacterium]